jgi:hypothetical protein
MTTLTRDIEDGKIPAPEATVTLRSRLRKSRSRVALVFSWRKSKSFWATRSSVRLQPMSEIHDAPR